MNFLRALCALCVLPTLLSHCGSAPPPKEPEPAHVEEQHAVKPALEMKSELGSIDPAAVKRTFSSLDDKFTDCQKRAVDRVEVLAGAVKFFVRIGEGGGVKWAYLTESDLGDRATEKCLLDAVAGASWPRPDGGDAEVQYGMELPQNATREPNVWGPEKVQGALAKNGGAIDKCKSGASANFRATMYVATGGRVIAAGVSTSARDGAERVDCLVKVLEGMKGLPSPGSWPAKVSFGL